MLDKIIEIAKNAGTILMKYHCKELDVQIKSDEYDFLTQADLESNDYIMKELRTAFPEDKILSEESEDIPEDYSGRVWMVDPLDGTKDFVHKGTGFSVMIGLCVDGKPVLGVVYAPAKDLLYYGEKEKGSYVEHNGKKSRLNVSDVTDVAQSTTVTRIAQGEKRELDDMVSSLGAREIPESSIGIKMGLVAEGKADSLINTNYRCSKWDTCAPQIILEEAGGVVTSFGGLALDYMQDSLNWEDLFVASNSLLHEDILEHVRKRKI